MKKIIEIWSRAVQVVLAAPIKLPGKALDIIKYIALGLGIIEQLVKDEKPQEENDLQSTATKYKSEACEERDEVCYAHGRSPVDQKEEVKDESQ
ncbi:hypothetical protein [Sphingobacterium sp. SYP-B4668]|uniref:hypothetical protein n=1 Tax=Sphingobacterium sp. SYP-B4668 TaxID=2996035 RepID=UPI0022DDEDF0|nr:hypothetical protein [Sphingobacterium sp. SYP-B4668]